MDLEPQIDTAPTQDAPAAPDAQPPVDAQPYEATDFYKDDQAAADGGDGDGGDDAPDADAGDDGDGQPPEADPIDAPLSWAKDAKEVFANLPREAQEVIANRERDRETFLQAKSREAANTRQQVETEARQVLQTLATNYQQQLERFDSFYAPQEPNPQLLATGDPAHQTLYLQQEAAYRAATAQRNEITQQMTQARQQADAIAQQQQQVELQAEHAMLEEKLGKDWSDPSSRAKLLGDLTPIAAELGYPQELIAQARACDILAMKNAAEWKAKADRYDALNKAKMIPVRAAKSVPPTARPTAPNGSRAPASLEAQLYPNDVRR